MNTDKLFIVGLPRTGTTSLCEFFLRHGQPTAHCAYTEAAMTLAKVIADTPVYNDYPELAKAYPQAKFILNQRPLEHWLPSIKHLLNAMREGLLDDKPLFPADVKRCFLSVLSPLSEDTIASDEHLTACFQRHQNDVIDRLQSRVITIDINDTKAPVRICDFLDIPYDGLGFKTLNTRGHIGDWRHIDHHLKIKPNRKNS